MGSFDTLHQSLAMLALAIASNMPSKDLFKDGNRPKDGDIELSSALPAGFSAKRLPPAIRENLRVSVARGDVTCIVPNPEPFVWLIVSCNGAKLRTVYGIWVGRAASWRGTVDPSTLPHLGMLTTKEAEAKGIPIPQMKE